MRAIAPLFVALTLIATSCTKAQSPTVTHRSADGRPDQWVYRISPDEYQLAVDSNGDGQPDVVRTFRDNEVVRVESDRNFNGKVDLVQEYSHGVLLREIRDDDFDGRPEVVKTFRPNGTLAIIERDPKERGSIDIVEYYDNHGRMTRREERPR
jgi:hypothetical protein